MGPYRLIVLLIYAVVVLPPFVKMFQRTGRSGWWAALMLVPLLNLVTLYFLAFGQWPAFDNSTKSSL